MVRVGGLQYSCEPAAPMGRRIGEMHLNGRRIEADKHYKVAGWAAVSEESRDRGGEPIWELMEKYLRDRKTVPVLRPNSPKLRGIAGDRGMSAADKGV